MDRSNGLDVFEEWNSKAYSSSMVRGQVIDMPVDLSLADNKLGRSVSERKRNMAHRLPRLIHDPDDRSPKCPSNHIGTMV